MDLLSRGTSSSLLASISLWWPDPEELKGEISSMSINRGSQRGRTREKATGVVSYVTVFNSYGAFTVALGGNLFNRFSTFTRLIRVIGYCLRFIHRAWKARPAEYARGTNIH